MKTSKVIRIGFLLLLLYYFLNGISVLHNNTWRISDELSTFDTGCALYSVVLIGIFLAITIGVTLIAVLGGYDSWFEKNTDPILNKICDFINRKNGGCKD